MLEYMRWTYFFKFWFTTVVLWALFLMLLLTSESSPFHYWRSIEFYLVILLPITALSFPIFTILAFIFQYLNDLKVETKKGKFIIVSTTIIGMILTQLITAGSIDLKTTYILSISIIISGMLFKLKRKVNQEDISNQPKTTEIEDKH